MPRPMQHPRQAPRGTACSVACGTLLPHSMSRKHVPVTARAKVHLRPGQDAQRGREWASRRARHGGSAPLTSADRMLRRLESAWSNGKPAYRNRHGHTSATRPESGRAKDTYVREEQILPHRRWAPRPG